MTLGPISKPVMVRWLCHGIGGVSKWMAEDYVRCEHTILIVADYVAYGHSPGKVSYLDVPKASNETSTMYVDQLKTTISTLGTVIYHAAVCIRHGVLAMAIYSRAI